MCALQRVPQMLEAEYVLKDEVRLSARSRTGYFYYISMALRFSSLRIFKLEIRVEPRIIRLLTFSGKGQFLYILKEGR